MVFRLLECALWTTTRGSIVNIVVGAWYFVYYSVPCGLQLETIVVNIVVGAWYFVYYSVPCGLQLETSIVNIVVVAWYFVY